MYVDTSSIKKSGKVFTRHLLRNSYREDGKVKHRTVANLSSCSEDEIAAMKLALKHKKDLSAVASLKDVKAVLGKSIGAVWVTHVLSKRNGIAQALGADPAGRLALLQVLARVINQGSRLSAVRLAQRHALCEVLGIQKLDEDDLYENLAWLSDNQEAIEKKLFALRYPNTVPTLFLYDVTSSYLEGICNELADWGYDRDKKRGKKQIVIGLLVDPAGLPVAVRVFKGNTKDTKTVSEQVKILANSFGVKEVTLVGDRGMIRGPQIDELPDDFRYITAITKPEITKMLSDGVLQYSLFDEKVCEVTIDKIRYILRRNPVRAEQLATVRESKVASLRTLATDKTRYLAEHPRATVKTAIACVRAKIKRIKAEQWIKVTKKGRTLSLSIDKDGLSAAALLDGCYVIKSDVSATDADAQTLHDRYCDLESIERCFRTMKMTHLEMRPVFVIKEKSTRGHIFVVMLALIVQREMEKSWLDLNITVEEGILVLSSVCMQEINLGNASVQNIPTPNEIGTQLLSNIDITLPSALSLPKANVHTKKKLQKERVN